MISRNLKALFANIFQHLLVLSLAAAHQGGKDLQFAAFPQGQQVICHLLHCLRGYLAAAIWAMLPSDPCVKQAQVIEYLSDRADCRAGILAR